VARYFSGKDAEIIDADKIARQLLCPGNPVYKKISGIFGKEIIGKGKSIDRAKLGKIVFQQKEMLVKLNRIMHPAIIGIIKKKIIASRAQKIILDAPLLIETGLHRIVSGLVVVSLSRSEQLRRINMRLHLNREEALGRIKAQIPLSQKIRLADFVIDNSGTRKKTKKQVTVIRRLLWKN
jgi:dephospho-CoA kinase